MAKLTKEEKIIMKDYFRMVDYAEEFSAQLSDLMDEEKLRDYLHEIKREFGTDSIFVAASQLMKRLGYNLALPPLYMMTVKNVKLDMPLDQLWIVPNVVDGKWLPNLYMEEIKVEEFGEDREAERREYCENLFRRLGELVQLVSDVARVPKPTLWENIAIYVYWIYEKKLMEEPFAQIQGRVKEDYEFLLRGLGAEAFDDNCNQLRNFYWGRRVEADGTRIRRTCCFYYGANEERKPCSTCPKTPEELARPIPFE
ncbi:hypothetical protein CEY16_06890 [Halalkalibacillus sediminis]|uniref:Aerobactin siderophore biosynthesis IucA/IucC-like C-terminal domain-containing protein n=1 Tax=Halalkalibacillus sediminis TaxID=2018042 RepID=A0A2I0QTH9_9BACI|nr:hypothetical protein [Halalkalibacillus sediminis]PKR77655.1 hypothetical protein CEY16_06890 [Halalkalibacillus sediminis]